MASFQFFTILFSWMVCQNQQLFGAITIWGVKFHEWLTSTKFTEFMYLEKNQLYGIATAWHEKFTRNIIYGLYSVRTIELKLCSVKCHVKGLTLWV